MAGVNVTSFGAIRKLSLKSSCELQCYMVLLPVDYPRFLPVAGPPKRRQGEKDNRLVKTTFHSLAEKG